MTDSIAACAEPVANPWITVALVAGNRIRTLAACDLDGVHQRLEVLGFMRLPGGDQCPKRHALGIRHKMKLRAKASPGSSQGEVIGLIDAFLFDVSDAPAA